MTSSTPKNELNSELESFRQQWLSDLRTKNEHEHEQQQENTRATSGGPSKRRPSHHDPPAVASNVRKHWVGEGRDEDYIPGPSFDAPASSSQVAPVKEGVVEKELVTALDHYEAAMEKEGQGSMGDSLKLYRQAYRLDNHVDRTYRQKHFPSKPAPKPQPHQRTPSLTKPAAPLPEPPQIQSIKDLITSFAHVKIEPAAPEVEGMPEPPCPIASLPDEILVHIMRDVAVDDVADFARLARVCKHFSFLVATEERIWRRVVVGEEVGFQTMHHHWQAGVEWEPLEDADEVIDGTLITPEQLALQRQNEKLALTRSLTPSVYPTWKSHFRSRPRLRFNGCYISTVNYVRTGQASTGQATWGNPIHIVTYYRYLRFFRDGTCISLLTTDEPLAVVYHLTRADLSLHRGNAHAHLPSAVMVQAYKGRWRMSSAEDAPDVPVKEAEGDVFVETEGVGNKYVYRMDLTMKSAGKGTRNNKLGWKGFYFYNKLTDDWAEFALKNDKPFFFSRVKSYGAGE